MRGHVSADQAAALLGVRLQTIYAYVSRGLLTRTHLTNESGHRVSGFAREEVLRLRPSAPGSASARSTSSSRRT